jgi:hypothetical protein
VASNDRFNTHRQDVVAAAISYQVNHLERERDGSSDTMEKPKEVQEDMMPQARWTLTTH